MFDRIKSILLGKRKKFNTICKANQLSLNYNLNKNELQILSDIFEDREYADYFPFYQKATIIDIGAHYGYFSIFAAKNTNNQSTILALEPAAMNFERMTENIRENKIENIVTINAALGAKNEFSNLYLGKTSNNSLINDYSFIDKEATIEKVALKTLETILTENKIEKVDFLKMDCEGAEYSILERLSKEAFDKIATLSLEFHDLKNEKYTGDFLVKLLTDHHFNIVKYRYMKTTMGLNYGKIIGTKHLK